MGLLDITYDAEISCGCIETFAGIKFNVPCSWSNLPSCALSGRSLSGQLSTQVNDNFAKCGELIQENGDWICDDNECALSCHHGYVASDEGHSMAARCLCSKHGECRWHLPSQCLRVNKIPN